VAAIGMHYELYGHIIGIYREKGGEGGAEKEGKWRERTRGMCNEAKVK